MNITATLTTGNFSVIVSGDVKETKVKDYVKNGIVYDLQRTPITKAYLAVAGVPGKKDGVLVFPEGFTRDSVAYEADTATLIADKVKAHFGTVMDDCRVVVTQHIKDEASDGRSKARAIYAKWTAEGKLTAKLDVIEFDGDETDEEAVIEAIHAYLIKP